MPKTFVLVGEFNTSFGMVKGLLRLVSPSERSAKQSARLEGGRNLVKVFAPTGPFNG